MLICGPPGSGKSTLALHLAARLGLGVVRRRGVDLTGDGLGGPARALAAAFAAARARHAVLVLDGIAQVAVDHAAPDAEGAALETLLACLDDHPLPVLCTTDLPHRLDRAVLRRFLVTLRLSALDPGRTLRAYRAILGAEPPGPLPDGLTIGDLVAVQRRRDLLGGEPDASTLLMWLSERTDVGGMATKEVGFRLRTDRAEHGWPAATKLA
jgi:SpoVK/Ycf46/Vps4 family AAA+-type ATPase